MDIAEPVARRATDLLLGVASGDTEAAVQYDSLLFPLLRNVALRRGRWMAISTAARFRKGQSNEPPLRVPEVRSADLEEVAVVAAELALVRARASALRFDPARGDGATWALGALGAAYLDAARDITRSRRAMVEVSIDAGVDDFAALAPPGMDTERVVESRDTLRRLLDLLPENQRDVVVARYEYGLTHLEIAAYVLRDETKAASVDRLLRSARKTLQAAYDNEQSEA